jgi:hypothetical protein
MEPAVVHQSSLHTHMYTPEEGRAYSHARDGRQGSISLDGETARAPTERVTLAVSYLREEGFFSKQSKLSGSWPMLSRQSCPARVKWVRTAEVDTIRHAGAGRSLT